MASGRVPRTAMTLQGFDNCVHSKGGGRIRRNGFGYHRRLLDKTIRPDPARALVHLIDHLLSSPILARILIARIIRVARELMAGLCSMIWIWTFLLTAILSAYLRVGYVLPLACGSFGFARFYVRPNAASHRFSALHNDEGSAIVSEWGYGRTPPAPRQSGES
jgi:hypothetical protein